MFETGRSYTYIAGKELKWLRRARCGGEEFILILHGADITSAMNISGNVKPAIAEGEIEHLGNKIV